MEFEGKWNIEESSSVFIFDVSKRKCKNLCITFEMYTTGVDMVGLAVTATFSGTTSKLILCMRITGVPDMGGVVGDVWRLTQQRDTLGGNDANVSFLGLGTL
jgi:hypothetical protein